MFTLQWFLWNLIQQKGRTIIVTSKFSAIAYMKFVYKMGADVDIARGSFIYYIRKIFWNTNISYVLTQR